MNFAVKYVGSGTERIGYLAGLSKFPGATIETPTSALFTQGGSVVHVTTDTLSRVFSKPQLLWLPLSNTIQLEAGVKAQGEGVAKFAGVPGHATCVTLHNINELTPPGHFEQDKVPLWTKNGKKMITANRYMEVMEVFKPDMILAVADNLASLDKGSKRIAKSVDRTCQMLETCIRQYKASNHLQNSALIGVIVGAGQLKKCEECIQHILKQVDCLSGFALAGITDGTDGTLDEPIEKLEDIFKRIAEVLPGNKVRIVEGPWNPAAVVTAIQYGWDVFDGSYPVKLTNAGQALALNFDINRDSDELCILDLVDIQYKEDFRPVLEGCECLACKKHTRAYIRHLLNTREMLANVLLSIHNLHHFDQMFHHARSFISTNMFQVYKQHITKQYELYKSSKKVNDLESTQINGKNNDEKELDIEREASQLKKKIRVSKDQTAHNVVASTTVVM